MELIQALGIDWRILLAQFLNFAILIFVLWRFAYKPIFKFLEERRKKIEDGIKNAEQISQKMIEMKEEERAIVIGAKKEALNLINEAKENAEKRGDEMIKKAQEEALAVISKERDKFNQEKVEIFKEMRNNLSELVVLAVEKVIEEKMSGEKDEEIIRKALNN